jgi:hypothetical protein
MNEYAFRGFVQGALIVLALALGLMIFTQFVIARELVLANRHLAEIAGSSDSCIAIILPPAPTPSPDHISHRSRP